MGNIKSLCYENKKRDHIFKFINHVTMSLKI